MVVSLCLNTNLPGSKSEWFYLGSALGEVIKLEAMPFNSWEQMAWAVPAEPTMSPLPPPPLLRIRGQRQ